MQSVLMKISVFGLTGDDHCGFYVPKELVETYRTVMLPLASVITPNTFEAEHLSGVTIRCVVYIPLLYVSVSFGFPIHHVFMWCRWR